MNKVFLSIVFLFLGIAGVLIVQAMQTSTSQVFTPSELAEVGESESFPRVRVVGKIAPEKLEYKTDPVISLSFQILDPEGDSKEKVIVRYDKLMPDMFAPGRSVIIDGEFRDGVVYAKNLMTQCPSKYEPPTPMEKMAKDEYTNDQLRGPLFSDDNEPAQVKEQNFPEARS